MSVADVFGTLEGKVALVTGAGGGIGAASCAALKAAGATVVATDIDPTGASRCTADDFVVADISDPDQVEVRGLVVNVGRQRHVGARQRGGAVGLARVARRRHAAFR